MYSISWELENGSGSHVAMRIKGLSQQRKTRNGTSGKLNQFGIKINKKIVSI